MTMTVVEKLGAVFLSFTTSWLQLLIYKFRWAQEPPVSASCNSVLWKAEFTLKKFIAGHLTQPYVLPIVYLMV